MSSVPSSETVRSTSDRHPTTSCAACGPLCPDHPHLPTYTPVEPATWPWRRRMWNAQFCPCAAAGSRLGCTAGQMTSSETRNSVMKAQAFDGISRDLEQISTRRSLTRLLSGVAALATMAVAGGGDAEAKKHKSKKKAKPGASGPAGPAGATGATGATGEAGAPGAPGASLSFGTSGGNQSAVLGATVGSEVESIAECGPGSAPISCDWTYIGNADAFDRTTTQVGSGSFRGVGSCTARLRRTATVANAGGQIIVSAICTQ